MYKLKGLLAQGSEFRLSANDRAFLTDLAKVQVISADLAHTHHYGNRKTPASARLNKLVEAGLLKRHINFDTTTGRQPVYEFANSKIAKSWGGRLSSFASNCSLAHELITSRLYFALDRPADFRKENDFKKTDQQLISSSYGHTRDHKPDALYTNDDGEICVVEADAGHYTRTQIRTKQVAWRHLKQVWGQPTHAHAPITSGPNIQAFTF